MSNKRFEKKLEDTIKKYKLFSKKEKILVAASGGKDSSSLLYALKKLGYKIEAITVDAVIGNYTKDNLERLRKFCKEQKIKLHEVSFRKEFGHGLLEIKKILSKQGIKPTSCTICGILRRYLLNKYARKLKFKKIATGHNLDDEAQSIMMNYLKNNLELTARLGPTTGIIRDKKFVVRVKPFYLITEEEIVEYSKELRLPVKYGRCPCSEGVFRRNMGKFIDESEVELKNIKKNIVNNFLRNINKYKQYYADERHLKYCKKCGEPAKWSVCRTCQILDKIKIGAN